MENSKEMPSAFLHTDIHTKPKQKEKLHAECGVWILKITWKKCYTSIQKHQNKTSGCSRAQRKKTNSKWNDGYKRNEECIKCRKMYVVEGSVYCTAIPTVSGVLSGSANEIRWRRWWPNLWQATKLFFTKTSRIYVAFLLLLFIFCCNGFHLIPAAQRFYPFASHSIHLYLDVFVYCALCKQASSLICIHCLN